MLLWGIGGSSYIFEWGLSLFDFQRIYIYIGEDNERGRCT